MVGAKQTSTELTVPHSIFLCFSNGVEFFLQDFISQEDDKSFQNRIEVYYLRCGPTVGETRPLARSVEKTHCFNCMHIECH